MNLRALPWIQIVLSVVIVLLCWWVYATKMEWYEDIEFSGYSNEARENPLYASSLLLDRYGYSSNHVEDSNFFNTLGEKNDGVVWLMEADVITEDRLFNDLVEWTERGGHLILGLDDPMSDRLDETLVVFDIEAYTSFDVITKSPPWMREYKKMVIDFEDDDREDELVTRSPHVEPAPKPLTGSTLLGSVVNTSDTQLTFRPEASKPQAITIQYDNKAEIFTEKRPVHGVLSNVEYWNKDSDVSTDNAYVNVQVRYGKGLVTVLGDAYMFSNRNMKNRDNGAYLLHLLNTHPSTDVSYFTGLRSTPGLISTLWEKFPALLSLLALALLGWVLYAASRLGPIRTEQAPGRTNLVTHLRARGHFWRRRGDLKPMSEPVRQAALREIKRQYANTLKPDDTELPAALIKKIAAEIGCSAPQVQRALGPNPLSARELPNAAVVLQHILHKSLPHSTKATGHSS